MISGYAGSGHGEEATTFFVDMVRSGVQPDDITFGAVLHACSSLAVLGHGSVHAFNDIFQKDLVPWNAMLFAFGLHGQATQALQVFKEMVENGVKPDSVTFIGLLMTCSHNGLIEESRMFMGFLLKWIKWHAWWICLAEAVT
ncbi:hypothetical protein CerSpe_215180 [Prunus speciosa]